MSYKSKKEFKMSRNGDKRKDSNDNQVCLKCKLDFDDCKCEEVKDADSKSCKHCNYDYTKKEGMLSDKECPNSIYLRDEKKWLIFPCDKCNKEFASKINEIIEWVYENEYEHELSMRKIDLYLDRMYGW